jgi:hypothetical protein
MVWIFPLLTPKSALNVFFRNTEHLVPVILKETYSQSQTIEILFVTILRLPTELMPRSRSRHPSFQIFTLFMAPS